MTVPTLPPNCNSWVIIRLSDQAVIGEVWNPQIIAALNPITVTALPTLTYLQQINKRR